MNRIGLLVALLTVTAQSARAEMPVFPSSYSTVTSGGRYVFVMLAPPKYSRHESAPGEALRKTYKQSGLYLNDGSREPIWTVEGYSRQSHPASDGVHLVCVSPFPLGNSPAGQDLRFYSREPILPMS